MVREEEQGMGWSGSAGNSCPGRISPFQALAPRCPGAVCGHRAEPCPARPGSPPWPCPASGERGSGPPRRCSRARLQLLRRQMILLHPRPSRPLSGRCAGCSRPLHDPGAAVCLSAADCRSGRAPAPLPLWPHTPLLSLSAAQGAKLLPLIASLALGLALKFLVKQPAAVSVQGWNLLCIFVSTIAGALPW